MFRLNAQQVFHYLATCIYNVEKLSAEELKERRGELQQRIEKLKRNPIQKVFVCSQTDIKHLS